MRSKMNKVLRYEYVKLGQESLILGHILWEIDSWVGDKMFPQRSCKSGKDFVAKGEV